LFLFHHNLFIVVWCLLQVAAKLEGKQQTRPRLLCGSLSRVPRYSSTAAVT
jgi:hypothetical protein